MARWWRIWQVVNACFAAVVLFYVFFDVLDVDGSKLFLPTAPRGERTVITAEEPAVDSERCRAGASVSSPLTLDDEYCPQTSLQHRIAKLPKISSLLSAQAHGDPSALLIIQR